MLNIIDFIFLNLAFTVTLTGSLINRFENYIPAVIIKGYRYGSFAYKGTDASYLEVFEISKAYYRHFYVFSSVFSFSALSYMLGVYFLNISINEYVMNALRILLLQDVSSVCVTAGIISMALLTVQCFRRFHETYSLQVFASSSKMNISHYLAGIIHYFSCVIVIIGQSPLFSVDDEKPKMVWLDTYTAILSVPCISIFLWAWYEQYQSNKIFASLRRDKSGQLVTEDHRIPYGRLFHFISSPHRFCEIIMYTILLILVPTQTFLYIYLWVIGNQVQTAIQAHEWYKKTFKVYPKERYAIIPAVL